MDGQKLNCYSKRIENDHNFHRGDINPGLNFYNPVVILLTRSVQAAWLELTYLSCGLNMLVEGWS